MERGRYLMLFYDYVDDIVERRGAHRDAHLAAIEALAAAGTIVAAGALGEPVTGAAIVFATDDEAAVQRFVDADPYVAAGLVTGWRIVPWMVVA